MIRILMVCLGNICRSPLAEGILRDKITKLGLDAEVHSAGTGSYHVNEPADLRSVEVARKNGVDISRHIASQFKQSDFNKYDLIYAMDDENYHNITALAKTQSDHAKVKLLMNEALPGENLSVPDPYFGGEDGFKNVYRMIDHACSKIAEKLN